jgi:hypothetical protein
MTAAEIAAAQAAAAHAAQVTAAQVLAAEQAAALAAQQATAAAATNTAAATATNAATNQSVLNAIGAGGAPVSTAGGLADLGVKTLAQEVGTKTGIEAVFQNAVSNTPSMSQAEFLNNSLAGGNTPFNPVTGAGTPLSPLIPTPIVAPPAPLPIPQLPTINTAEFGTQYLQNTMPGSVPGAAPPVPPAPPAAPTTVDVSSVSPNTGPSLGGAGTGYQGSPIQIGSASNATPYTPAELQIMQGQSPSGIESLFNKGLEYAQKNPLSTAMGAMSAANYLNPKKPEEKEKYKSTFNRNTYQAYNPVQPTPYQPQYAVGGLANLGGYSDGGRMLKGPGDGMSDDIPATIAGKQPARLANEEFVIPADVVSHLGNGSSEAGAKQLYKMMDRIRKARTGTKKQGKQINPEKYLA